MPTKPAAPASPSAVATVLAALCYACNMPLDAVDEEEGTLSCMVAGCYNRFHSACSGASNISNEEKSDWACPECRCRMKKGGDYSHTPVGASRIKATNVTLRKKVSPKLDVTNAGEQSFLSLEYIEITSEIKLVREEMAGLKEMLSKVTLALTQYDSKLELLNSKLAMTRQAPQTADVITNSFCSDGNVSYATIVASPPPVLEIPQIKRPAVHNSNSTAKPVNNEPGKIVEPAQSKTKVAHGNYKRPSSIRCTGNPATTSLKAVERRRFIHLWNMVSGREDVKQHLAKICPSGECTVEELKSKGDYKSYKISIPEVHFEKCFVAEAWPDNARLKIWVPFRSQKPTVPAE